MCVYYIDGELVIVGLESLPRDSGETTSTQLRPFPLVLCMFPCTFVAKYNKGEPTINTLQACPFSNISYFQYWRNP